MQVEAPPGEEMERELTAPKIIASLAFGGSLVVLGDEGMPFNPMGMMTCEKAMQKMFCPEKYKVGQSDAPTERRRRGAAAAAASSERAAVASARSPSRARA